MISNRWIESSRKAFAAFLNLYPREHRSNYGTAMQQVFTEQCRSACEEKGGLGMILLWLHTLPDLGRTALLEHMTAPGASAGLMEPIPNAPLPWKGVLLVLLPGLVYLVSQAAQLSGEAWYLTVYYRAAFLLILPVLAVWAITRRFPIWGLIPLGLLYRLVQEIGYQLITLHPGAFSGNVLLNAVLNIAKLAEGEPWLSVVVFILASVLLARRYIQQQRPSRGFWLLLGMYLLVVGAQIAYEIILAQESATFLPNNAQGTLRYLISLDLYNFSAVLLLIFIGTLFTNKHGFFAILVPLGYLLPAILLGVGGGVGGYFGTISNPDAALAVAGIAILIYRSLLSLIAPIWMSRTGSQSGKIRVVLISMAIALGIQTMMRVYPALLWPGDPFPINRGVFAALDDLQIISAILLGINMYQDRQPASELPAQPPIQYAEVSSESV